MKLSRVAVLIVALLVPQICLAQSTSARANRAWKPFLATLRNAVKRRDKDALAKHRARDFY
jgi:hypothetical protein